MNSNERQVYKDIKMDNPLLAQKFADCLEYAQYGWQEDARDFSGDAFSNAIQRQPCCNDLDAYLSHNPQLLRRAKACINKHKP